MESKNPFRFKLFGRPDGVSHFLLNDVANQLGTELGKTAYKEFSNGEFLSHHDESVRDCDVYYFAQPRFGEKKKLSYDLDLMESMVFALKQGSPNRISVIIPCLPYARQDRASNYREPVLVQKVPMRMQMAGANRIITLRLHNPSSYNAHPNSIPIVNIPNRKLLIQHILSKGFDLSKFMIVSPDLGAAAECRKIAEELGIPGNIIIINKYRDPKKSNKSEVMDIIGDPKGFNCIMPDDMADTSGTALKSFVALKDKGALDVYFSAVHPILSGKALENLDEADFKGVWFCNTCNLEEKANKIKNLDIIPVTKLMAKVIRNLHNGDSITDL
jgi:ribose-phosphate pyrophosphokinase